MVQPYNINIPNPGEQMLAGIQAGQDYMIKYKAQQEQARMQEDLAAFSQKEDKTPEDVQKLIFKYPVLNKQLDQSLQNLTEQQKENRISQLTPIYMTLNKGNTDVAKAQVDELIAAYQNSGNEFEAKNLQTLKSNIELDPQGAITSSELLIYKAMGPEALQQYLTASQKARTETKEGLKGRVQPHTETTPDGTVWAVNDRGEVTVTDITGRKLEGEEAKQAWLKGQEYGVDIAKRTNFSREEGKLEAQKGLKAEIQQEVSAAQEAEKKKTQFYDQYQKIQENINTLDEGIAIIEKGLAEGKDLGLGPIRRYFPAWGKTAQSLKNVADRMGLNVVSSVTFGALNEEELKMALRTAKPPDLKGRDLLEWMQDRKAAQEKLGAYLSDAANFIGSPKEGGGINTVADWMAYNEAKKKQPTAAPAETSASTGKTIVRTGTYKGRKVVQYSDGSMEYAD